MTKRRFSQYKDWRNENLKFLVFFLILSAISIFVSENIYLSSAFMYFVGYWDCKLLASHKVQLHEATLKDPRGNIELVS
jgi:hypothetical protein